MFRLVVGKRFLSSVLDKNRECFVEVESKLFSQCLAQILTSCRTEKTPLAIKWLPRAIIFQSLVDKCFSAGADLKERAMMNEAQVESFVDKLRSTFSSIEALEVPTIAAIDGSALGGGLEMALSCDIRIAGASAKLGLPEVKLGILPAAGGSQRLPRLLGASKAKELIFTGQLLDSKEAFNIGLVNRKAESAFELAVEMAQKIAQNGPLAVRMAKRAIQVGSRLDLYRSPWPFTSHHATSDIFLCRPSGLLTEKLCYAQLLKSQDRLEGLKAFAEGRTPIYSGK